MNNLFEIINKNNFHPKSYQRMGKVWLITSNNHKYAIKLNVNNDDIYKYLLAHDFTLFPNHLNVVDDNYDLMEYIEDESLNKNQKINDYIKVLAILHQKTSYLREIDLDEIKKEYEEINTLITRTHKYYYDLNDVIDHESFLSPSTYLLVRNISLIYALLDKSKILLNKLYEKIKNMKSIRVSLLHNNIDLDHLIINNQPYLISWDQAYFNNPIYDLENFYRKYYLDIELDDFFKIYERINKLSNEEKTLLIIKLSIPHQISFSNNTYIDTKKINEELIYLNKVYELLVTMQEK